MYGTSILVFTSTLAEIVLSQTSGASFELKHPKAVINLPKDTANANGYFTGILEEGNGDFTIWQLLR